MKIVPKPKDFDNCCENVGIKPTKRQHNKFKSKRGLAYTIGIRFDTWFDDPDKTVRFQQALKISNDKYSQKV